MSAEAALVRSWPVGPYTCVLTMRRPQPGKLVFCCIEWLPELPEGLTAHEHDEYRRGRDLAFADVADEFGLTALVLDL